MAWYDVFDFNYQRHVEACGGKFKKFVQDDWIRNSTGFGQSEDPLVRRMLNGMCHGICITFLARNIDAFITKSLGGKGDHEGTFTSFLNDQDYHGVVLGYQA